jgi:hypothetical protein
MRALFWIVGVMCAIGALLTDLQAKSAIHQILAQISYLIAAVLIVGAEVVGAINGARVSSAAALNALAEKLSVLQSIDHKLTPDRFSAAEAPAVTNSVQKLRDAGCNVARGEYSGWKVTDSEGKVSNISTAADLIAHAESIVVPGIVRRQRL